MPSPHEMYDEAIELKNSGDLEGAVAKLQEVLTVDPDHSDTHSALSVYLQRLGRFTEAIDHARKVCEVLPNEPFSYTQLSQIYVKCGMRQEAEDALAKAREIQMQSGH